MPERCGAPDVNALMTPLQSLANRTYEVVLSNLTCTENWGYFLFDDKFKHEYQLRSRIGVIWLCSLLDTMEAQQRFLPEIKREAMEDGLESIAHSTRELQKFCFIVGELLSEYSREEQIYLQDHRNTLVHSYLASRHRTFITVKHYSNSQLNSERLPWDAYHQIIRSFLETTPHWETDIYELLARVLSDNHSHRYWQVLANLQARRNDIYYMLCEGKLFTLVVS